MRIRIIELGFEFTVNVAGFKYSYIVHTEEEGQKIASLMLGK